MKKQMPKLRKISLKKALAELIDSGRIVNISFNTAYELKKKIEALGIDCKIEYDLDFFDGDTDEETRRKCAPSILLVD